MPTLTTYRQRAAQELGEYVAGTATSGSTTSVVECTTWPFRSSLDTNDEYKDQWLLRPAAGTATDKVRYVKDVDRSTGKLTPDQTYTTAAYTGGVGESFELHGVIEPLTEMTRLINIVLKRIAVEVEFSFAPTNATNTRHTLATAASWLLDPRWVRQVGVLASGESRDQVDPFRMRRVRGQAVRDGATIYLLCGSIPTSSTIYVKAVRPAYNYCAASAGAYGSQNGLSLETDIAVPNDDWVAAGVLVEAWKKYGHLLDQAAGQKVVRDRAEAAVWFSHLTDQYFAMPELTLRPLYRWGPL